MTSTEQDDHNQLSSKPAMKSSPSAWRQPTLKPQDVITVVRLSLSQDESSTWSFVRLGEALALSPSEAHGSVQRGITCGLISREFDELQTNRVALMDFLVHGIRYVFPPLFGPIVQGVRTTAYVRPLSDYFPMDVTTMVVWPDPEGSDRGISLCPLYPTVPLAARRDQRLHEALALVDAIRAGSARERELGIKLLQEYFA